MLRSTSARPLIATPRQGEFTQRNALLSLVLGDANSRNKFAVSGHDFSRAATGA